MATPTSSFVGDGCITAAENALLDCLLKHRSFSTRLSPSSKGKLPDGGHRAMLLDGISSDASAEALALFVEYGKL